MQSYLPENSNIHYLEMRDGVRIRAGFFPAKNDVYASVLLIGGHREFLEKYSEFIEELQCRGFNVYSFDLRGQGGSDRALKNRQKSHNPDFGAIVGDMDEIIKRFVDATSLQHPLYMIAHSMGAQFALRYLHDHPSVIDRAILLSPFTDLNIGGMLFTLTTKLYVMIANILGFSEFFAPGQAQNRSMIDHENAFSRLTNDRKRYDWSQKVLDEKPELFVGGVTFGWLKGVINSLKIIQQEGYVNQIKTPILGLLSGDEKVVDNAMTIKLLKLIPNASYEIISGARHEMYREVDEIRDQIIGKIERFFKI